MKETQIPKKNCERWVWLAGSYHLGQLLLSHLQSDRAGYSGFLHRRPGFKNSVIGVLDFKKLCFIYHMGANLADITIEVVKPVLLLNSETLAVTCVQMRNSSINYNIPIFSPSPHSNLGDQQQPSPKTKFLLFAILSRSCNRYQLRVQTDSNPSFHSGLWISSSCITIYCCSPSGIQTAFSPSVLNNNSNNTFFFYK